MRMETRRLSARCHKSNLTVNGPLTARLITREIALDREQQVGELVERRDVLEREPFGHRLEHVD